MNDLDLLRTLRVEVPEPTSDALQAAETRIMRAIRTQAARAGRPAGLPTVAWQMALAGGLAATVAAAALVLPGIGGPADNGGPSSAGPAITPVAVELLDQAALAADRTPELHPRPEQFIVYKSVTMYPAYTPDGRYLTRAKRTVWKSVDGTREGAVSGEPLPARSYPGYRIPPGVNDGVGKVQSSPLPICDTNPADNARTDYAYLSTLPIDPARLLEVLKQRQSGDPSEDRRAWTAIGDLLRESYLPPAQRAALFRAAKLIPAVTVVTNVEDAAGRPGIAVARIDEEQGTQQELIFNPTTFLYQGERTIVIDPKAVGALAPVPFATGSPAPTSTPAPNLGQDLPAGTELASTAELSVTVADAAPTFPPTGKYCG